MYSECPGSPNSYSNILCLFFSCCFCVSFLFHSVRNKCSDVVVSFHNPSLPSSTWIPRSEKYLLKISVKDLWPLPYPDLCFTQTPTCCSWVWMGCSSPWIVCIPCLGSCCSPSSGSVLSFWKEGFFFFQTFFYLGAFSSGTGQLPKPKGLFKQFLSFTSIICGENNK